MIFYFTGTGNSLYVANMISEAQGDQLYSIARLMDKKKSVYHFELKENELLGFVFPVYAWAPPEMVLDFIKKLEITARTDDSKKQNASGNPYTFYISTCGEEEGRTDKIVKTALASKGLSAWVAFIAVRSRLYNTGKEVKKRPISSP